jgi:hypothetical protein
VGPSLRRVLRQVYKRLVNITLRVLAAAVPDRLVLRALGGEVLVGGPLVGVDGLHLSVVSKAPRLSPGAFPSRTIRLI